MHDVQPLVVTESLGKRYRSAVALEDCSLTVVPGQVMGLLGPNGAGKTTLLRLLLGYLRPTTGRARIAGFDCYYQSAEVHRKVAYLPGDVRLFRNLRGRQVLEFLARLRNRSAEGALQLARQMDLDIRQRVAFMSTGMRQKLALAATLSADTPLVILDEPTSNLDPTMRALVAAQVRSLQQQGRTILFSSHVLAEVEEVCDRVALLRQGRLVHVQELGELRQRVRMHVLASQPIPSPPEELRRDVLARSAAPHELWIETANQVAPWLRWLGGLPVTQLRVEPCGLRSVYESFHGGPASTS